MDKGAEQADVQLIEDTLSYVPRSLLPIFHVVFDTSVQREGETRTVTILFSKRVVVVALGFATYALLSIFK